MTEPRLKFAAASGRVRALFEGHEIADSANALILREGDYPPVVYFPREDVEMLVMRKTDHSSHCPFKGDASYYTIYRDRQIAENAAWSYEDPIEGADLIRGRIAFYPQHVDIQMGDQGTNNAVAPDDSSPDTPRPGGEARSFEGQNPGEAQSLDGPVKVPPHDPPYADINPTDRIG
ncbi:MAG: nucleotidyltransferase protein [Caulobacter sp.]|jgi:uncharacterized protein (DUF427 family)|nr:nucleotidyltransferase protein [Caulobacter sp.]